MGKLPALLAAGNGIRVGACIPAVGNTARAGSLSIVAVEGILLVPVALQDVRSIRRVWTWWWWVMEVRGKRSEGCWDHNTYVVPPPPYLLPT
jgi:hypothetical protein